jgi:hypothetical protein
MPGMSDLADHLVSAVTPTAGEEEQWQPIMEQLAANGDLEGVLTKLPVSPSLAEKIVLSTRQLIADAEVSYFQKSATAKAEHPVTPLLRAMHRTSNHLATVITSNYDRLAEFAADQAGFDVRTGFDARHLGSFNAPSLEVANYRPGAPQKTLRILKPHGSLDWYTDSNGLAHFRSLPPDDWAGTKPLMVTPGVDKYRLTHGEPFRSILSQVDAALASAGSIICFGYGFNDDHLHEVITRQLQQGPQKLLIVAKALTPKAISFAERQSVIAIEEADGGSTIRIAGESPINIAKQNLWSLPGFCQAVL